MGVDARMFVRVPEAHLTPNEVRHLAADLREAVWDSVSVIKPGEFSWWPAGRHALEIITEFQQDGDTVVPIDGEQLIEVHLSGRYYGKGYERGDWPAIDGVCEWLTRRLPSASVWYGGDSSGICAERMTTTFRRRMWAHFAQFGHVPYEQYFSRGAKPRACAFCGDRPMDYYGGGNYNQTLFYRCAGCGLDEETRDGGLTWGPREREKATA